MLAFNGAGQAQGQAHGLKIAYLQVHVRGRTRYAGSVQTRGTDQPIATALRQAVTGLVEWSSARRRSVDTTSHHPDRAAEYSGASRWLMRLRASAAA